MCTIHYSYCQYITTEKGLRYYTISIDHLTTVLCYMTLVSLSQHLLLSVVGVSPESFKSDKSFARGGFGGVTDVGLADLTGLGACLISLVGDLVRSSAAKHDRHQ